MTLTDLVREPDVCAVCGLPILPEDASYQPYPPNGDWVHDDGEGGCRERYWDPPRRVAAMSLADRFRRARERDRKLEETAGIQRNAPVSVSRADVVRLTRARVPWLRRRRSDPQ